MGRLLRDKPKPVLGCRIQEGGHDRKGHRVHARELARGAGFGPFGALGSGIMGAAKGGAEADAKQAIKCAESKKGS